MSQFGGGGGGKPGGAWRPGGGGGGSQLPGFGVGNFPMMGMGVPMINQAAFQQPSMMGMGVMGAVPQQHRQAGGQPNNNVNTAAPASAKNRTFVGVVTKMHDSYGFVDDDVFFQHTVIRGANPRVGDKVMVEASYNPQMPFKWNAFRIQLLTGPGGAGDGGHQPARGPSPMQMQSAHGHPRNSGPPPASGGPGAMGPGSRWGPGGAQDRNGPPARASPVPPRRRTPPRRSPPPRRASPPRTSAPIPMRRNRTRTPPRRASPPPRDRKRERSPAVSVAPSTKRDSASPPRRRARIIPRYECRSTKPVLISDQVSVVHVRSRYPKLYVPSDFVDISVDWSTRVAVDSPIDLNNPVSFHVFHKDVDFVKGEGSENGTLEPTDYDNSHQVKVLLLAHSGKQELLKKAFGLLPDGSTDDTHEVTSIFKQLHFLVGARGKEHMAIGGSWSPSLDGADPSNPATIIKTAVRTTKALTGIDLSDVPQWYSMVQVRYYRAEKNRVDRVHLLLPDTQLLMPDQAAWEAQTSALQLQLQRKLADIDALSLKQEKPEETTHEAAPQAATVKEGEAVSTPITPAKAVDTKKEAPTPDTAEKTVEDVEMTESPQKPKPVPRHWNDLDVKIMKVAELKAELDARGLEMRGIKTLLAQRLQDALDKEQELEEDGPPEGEEIEMKDETEEEKVEEEKVEEKKPEVVTIESAPAKSEAELKKEAEEMQKKIEAFEKEKTEKKAALEKHYTMPKEPKVLVYPSKTAKSGKYDCKIVSLQTLLDYRTEDNKESQFEVSLLVEAVKEMLERHSAFTIYHALSGAADKDSERKRRDEARGRGEKDKTEDPENPKKDAEKEKSEKPEKVELKGVVFNRTLFEAFAMFDQHLCGYIAERDLEDILLNGEFGTTRSIVSKLAHKLSSRDRINYRNLTDRLLDSDGNVKFEPGHCENAPSVEVLSKGYGAQYIKQADGHSQMNGSMETVSSDGTVVINGNVVNVAQKLALLKKSEQERDAAKTALNEQNSLIEQLRGVKHDLEKKKKELEKDLEKNKKKLSDTGSALKASLEDGIGLKSSLADCRRYAERMVSVVDKACPPPPKEDKEKKSEDKDKSKDSKSAKTTEKTEDDEIPADALVLSDETGPEGEGGDAEKNTPVATEPAKTEITDETAKESK